jgi:PAS domain S-box-containing protein
MTKMSIAKTREQLIIENEELSSQLRETEEVLNAIRNGEVDAILVNGREGEQVYSISSAETPYRTFIEEMSEGAVTLTREGVILYCNRTFAELVNQPIESVIGKHLNSYLSPGDKPKIEHILARQPHKKKEVEIISLVNSLYLKLSFSLLPSYIQGDNSVLIVTDISELKKRQNELNELISKLVHHIKALRALRIDNINETIDVEGRKNKLELANKQLYKEITKLNRVINDLKKKKG